ncbi:MAG: winged helix-turn-helix transcriptional regulator [Thermoplasmatota archaeon]
MAIALLAVAAAVSASPAPNVQPRSTSAVESTATSAASSSPAAPATPSVPSTPTVEVNTAQVQSDVWNLAGLRIQGIPAALSSEASSGFPQLPSTLPVSGMAPAARALVTPSSHVALVSGPGAPVRQTSYYSGQIAMPSLSYTAAHATQARAYSDVPVPPEYSDSQSSGVVGPGNVNTEGSSVPIPTSPVGNPLGVTGTAAVAAGLAFLVVGPWALYHRIRGHSTLDNDTRKSIYDAVCRTPGVSVQEVAQVAGVTYSTTSYHLDRLVEAGMLVVAAGGSRLRYYKNGGQFTEEERRLVPIMENAEACRVLESILERPYTYRAAIAEKLGVSTTSVNWHLKRLLEAGLVRETREGRSAHLYADREQVGVVLGKLATKMSAMPVPAQRVLDRVAFPLVLAQVAA